MMEAKLLRAAILIVSDTVSQRPHEDRTTSAVRDVLVAEEKWEVTKEEIVSDDIANIQDIAKSWADTDVAELILVCGGTGFTTRDCTPEAILPLLKKQAPGLVFGMLSKSLSITPYAMMARPVAGVRKKSVIVTLPGSPKGAKENLDAIIKVLPHACRQVSVESSRELHAKMGDTTDVPPATIPARETQKQECSCSAPYQNAVVDGSKSLLDGLVHRPRQSKFPRVPFGEAKLLVFEHTPIMDHVEKDVDMSLIGHVISDNVFAIESVPAYDVSLVDGYAVTTLRRDPTTQKTFAAVRKAVHANSRGVHRLSSGEVIRVTTGAPIPENTTMIIKVEDTTVQESTVDGQEESKILISKTDFRAGENIRRLGSDIFAKEQIFPKNTLISDPAQVAVLLSTGVQTIRVMRKPIVGILSTGDELVEASHKGPLNPGQVRDTNRPCLIKLCEQFGYETVDLGITQDGCDNLEDKLRWGMKNCDIVLTSGGASMGETDLIKPVIEEKLGGRIIFGRLNIKPGMPTIFAIVKTKNEDGGRSKKVIFGLPGNPASAIAVFYTIVLPALRNMSGYARSEIDLPLIDVRPNKGEVMQDPDRTEFHRVTLSWCVGTKSVKATSTGGQRSSRVGSFAGSNGLIIVPPLSETVLDLEGDMYMKAIMTGPLI